MIVKERNWDNQLYREFKELLVDDLFNKIGIGLSTLRTAHECPSTELIENMKKQVDSYFYTLVASDTPMSVLLPDRLRDANNFYIFRITLIPTGGILLTFIALLRDDVEPVELQLMY